MHLESGRRGRLTDLWLLATIAPLAAILVAEARILERSDFHTGLLAGLAVVLAVALASSLTRRGQDQQAGRD